MSTQVDILAAIARDHGARMVHVKPHGGGSCRRRCGRRRCGLPAPAASARLILVGFAGSLGLEEWRSAGWVAAGMLAIDDTEPDGHPVQASSSAVLADPTKPQLDHPSPRARHPCRTAGATTAHPSTFIHVDATAKLALDVARAVRAACRGRSRHRCSAHPSVDRVEPYPRGD